jgi:hypothetical protein
MVPRGFRCSARDVRGRVALPDHRLEHPQHAPSVLVFCPLLPNGREEPEPRRVSCAQGGKWGRYHPTGVSFPGLLLPDCQRSPGTCNKAVLRGVHDEDTREL